MVLLWHHSEEPFSVPDGTLIFCVKANAERKRKKLDIFGKKGTLESLRGDVCECVRCV